MKYIIKYEIEEGHTSVGTNVVEGKSSKDAFKNWVFANFNRLFKRSFAGDGFENGNYKVEIEKATQIKARRSRK